MPKTPLRISSSFLLCLGLNAGATPAAVEMKTEKQELRLNCTAIREFVQLSAAAPDSPADHINAQIRREMTVGKRLREEDCPEAGSGESYEYHNRATVSGQNHGLIGVEYNVYFPGGSGRYVRRCSTFELSSGHMVNLKLCLSEDGLQTVQKALCPAASVAAACAQDFRRAEYCLTPDGLLASLPFGRSPPEARFSGAQLHKLLNGSCVL